ncbi:PREDICTED: 21 kDa protein [Tarenaya hassleriana]|uniref:21 kDa protein n=1 Tax=Tarenaya hassleriana TaxID=28532 RepID=UPI00053C38EC|nr:PREDICTED: 21 kDa protein [Tarenaya hassleriana]
MEVKRIATNVSHFLILSLAINVFTSSTPKTTATAPVSYTNYRAFVKTACNATTYPMMCYNSLSSYATAIKANPIKLCTTALSLNVKVAKEASSVVSKLLKKTQKPYGGGGSIQRPETLILRDCLDEIKDTIDELKQATVEMKNISRSSGDKGERVTNARTFLSSALTDETTCTDGFDEMTKVNADTKKKVKKVILNLSRTTSNALALVTALRY